MPRNSRQIAACCSLCRASAVLSQHELACGRVDLDRGWERGRRLHPITEDHVRGEVWQGERRELFENAGLIVKEVADRVFLAAGATNGCWFINEQGRLLRDRR